MKSQSTIFGPIFFFTILEQERRIRVYFLLNDEMRLILSCCCNPRLLLNVFCLMFYGEINGWRKKSQRARGSWLDFDEWLQCNQACSVPFQSFFMTIVVRSRKHHQISINLLTKKPRKKKKTSYLYSHKIKSWHGQKVSQSMLNTEKTHSIETNYQLFCDEGQGDYRERGKMSDGLVGNAESGYCGQVLCMSAHIIPSLQKKTQLEPQ